MSEWSLWFRLVMCVLATWRLVHLLAMEDGPFDAVVRLRVRIGNRWLGQAMDCPYCLSLWIAAPLALLLADSLSGWVVAWWGISGGAVLLGHFHPDDVPTVLPRHRSGE